MIRGHRALPGQFRYLPMGETPLPHDMGAERFRPGAASGGSQEAVRRAVWRRIDQPEPL